MAFALENFLFCLELQLGGIIMAWWGMIISALSLVGVVIGLITNEGHSNRFFPVNVSSNGALAGGVIAIIILVIYFYFSYQLLLGTQSGNSSQMFGYLIIHGILVVLFILGVFSNAATLIGAIIYAYLWFCIYSLYVRTGGSGIV